MQPRLSRIIAVIPLKPADRYRTFDGYLKLYGQYEQSKNELLPVLEQGELLESLSVTPSQHFTKPPARYTEARLIKELEEKGIGRPSTYASIIDTIQTRGYVELKEKAFYPTETGILTNDLVSWRTILQISST